MAYYGLSKPVIAKLDAGAETYTQGMVLAKAVGTSVTPEYSEGGMYADNAESEHIKVFKNAAVDAEVDSIPLKAGEIIFGHKVEAGSSASGTTSFTEKEISKADDQNNYVGYGFVGKEIINGKHIFTACWLPKVLFSEGADSWQSTGESITFNSQKLSGKALALKDGTWREKTKFLTEDAAYTYLKTKAGISEK